MGIIYYQAYIYEIFIREVGWGRGGDEDRRGRMGTGGDGQRLVLVGFGASNARNGALDFDSGVRKLVVAKVLRPNC